MGFFPGLDADLVDRYDMMIYVEDSQGLVANSTLTVIVIPVNDPPEFNVSFIRVTVKEELVS